MLVIDIGSGTLHEHHGCYLARGEYVGKESRPSVYRPDLGNYKRHNVPTLRSQLYITPTSVPMSCLSSSLANRRRVLVDSISVTR
jgi:hypothetical protein